MISGITSLNCDFTKLTVIVCESRCRHSTGVVWEGCNHLDNTKLDNKSAVLLGMKAHNNMVADAFREISEVSE